MLCDCGRPGIEGLKIQVILWVLKVTAIVPFWFTVFATSGLKKHIKRSDQDVEVHKEKKEGIWEKSSKIIFL